MKHNYLNKLLILVSLSMLNCNAQKGTINNNTCIEKISIVFDETDSDYNTIELPKNIKNSYNWVTLKIEKSIIESISEVYFDDILVKVEKHRLSNLFHKYSKEEKGVKLFIKLLDNRGCLEVLLDKKYNLVSLNKTNNIWELEYSGYYEIIWKE